MNAFKCFAYETSDRNPNKRNIKTDGKRSYIKYDDGNKGYY